MSAVGNVTELDYQGKKIHIIGTAHVSPASVAEVERVIRELKPDTVCVELDQTRFDAMTNENRFRELDIFQIIRQQKVLFLLANLMLSSFQKRMGDKLGIKPGAELLAGVNTAKEVGAQLVLADRDIQATLKRSWYNLGFFNKMQLLSVMVGSFLGGEEITEEQIEQLKERDTINEMMAEFARHMPRLQIPLIDERDKFLMSIIQEAPGKVIVGVVGAGHVTGMESYLGKTIDREKLSVIPTPSLLARSLKWIIPTLMLCAFYWGYHKHQGEGLERMLYAWVIPNSIGAALLAAIAGARPLTVIVSAIASPITSLNPTIGAGMVAGLVEAWLRKPTVADCESIGDALLSLKGMYKNPFTRVLLVAFGATMGSALGAYVGAALVVKLL